MAHCIGIFSDLFFYIPISLAILEHQKRDKDVEPVKRVTNFVASK